MTRWKTHGAQNDSRQEMCARKSRESTSATHVANSIRALSRSTPHLRTHGPAVGAKHSQFRHHIRVRPVWDMVYIACQAQDFATTQGEPFTTISRSSRLNQQISRVIG